MTTRPDRSAPPATDDSAAIVGEAVAPPAAAVIPSNAQIASNADRARGRTAVQVSLPAAIVGIGTWAAGFAHLDLDPLGVGKDLPGPVAGYFVAVVAYLLCVRMNPKPGNGDD